MENFYLCKKCIILWGELFSIQVFLINISLSIKMERRKDICLYLGIKQCFPTYLFDLLMIFYFWYRSQNTIAILNVSSEFLISCMLEIVIGDFIETFIVNWFPFATIHRAIQMFYFLFLVKCIRNLYFSRHVGKNALHI